MENSFVLVPHSPLLRAIVPTTGYASVFQLCLPVSTRTLRSMLEVLYTGEISATRAEVEEIKTGLTLLGILSPSDCPPPPPQQPRVKESDSSLAVGVINSSQVSFLLTARHMTSSVNVQARDAVSAVSLAVSESQARPTVELFARAGETEVSNELRLHRTDQETPENNINNNNNNSRNENENLGKESRARRRRRVRSYCEDEEAEDMKEEKTEEEFLLDGVAVTKEVDCCQDCGASLPSEWHRPPNRHDCQAMSETVCQVGLSHSSLSNININISVL